MIYPLVRDLAADGIPVVVTCRVLHFTPQAFYRWRADPISNRDWSDAHLVDAALAIHAGDPVSGYRFIADELEAEHGICARRRGGIHALWDRGEAAAGNSITTGVAEVSAAGNRAVTPCTLALQPKSSGASSGMCFHSPSAVLKLTSSV